MIMILCAWAQRRAHPADEEAKLFCSLAHLWERVRERGGEQIYPAYTVFQSIFVNPFKTGFYERGPFIQRRAMKILFGNATRWLYCAMMVLCCLSDAVIGTAVAGTVVSGSSTISATVTLGNLNFTYDGTVKNPTCYTVPTGLAATLSYSDIGSGVGLINAGSYGVTCTVTEAGYSGTASDTLVIAPATLTGINPNNVYVSVPFSYTRVAAGYLPIDGHVAAGTASFALSGTTMTIQSSPEAVIDWADFSIGAGATVNIIQQAADSTVLIRVIGSNPLQIIGRLNSNGRVFIIDSEGILFDASAAVNVAGLVASTLDLADANFLSNKWQFSSGVGSNAIVNMGSVTAASGGSIYLVSPDINNAGAIGVAQGAILLAAGTSVDLTVPAAPVVSDAVGVPASIIYSSGLLSALNGTIGLYVGAIDVNGALNAGGNINVTANGTINFASTAILNANTVSINTGAAISANAGTLTNTGAVTLTGAITGGNVGIVSLTGTSTGALTNVGAVNLTAGTQIDVGAVTLAAGTLSLVGTATVSPNAGLSSGAVVALDPNALPTGGSVTAGAGSIAQSGVMTTITQNSQNAVINWNSFNIGANATVNFAQPNSSSVVLNRVVDTDSTQIFGQLSSNGKVFLVNPAGVLFGTSAILDTGALVNSTGTPVDVASLAISTDMQVNTGWNLLGNSTDAPLDVATALGDANKVNTVWKWNPATNNWAFYTPSQTDGGAAYAATKGYDFLTSINSGEGFWVNARMPFVFALPIGKLLTAATQTPPTPGWNMVSVGENNTPSQFDTALSPTQPAQGVIPQNVTTLWAWNSGLSKWYFYAPSLEAQGGTALTDYITAKGYLDFSVMNKTLGPGMGFWVNKQ